MNARQTKKSLRKMCNRNFEEMLIVGPRLGDKNPMTIKYNAARNNNEKRRVVRKVIKEHRLLFRRAAIWCK